MSILNLQCPHCDVTNWPAFNINNYLYKIKCPESYINMFNKIVYNTHRIKKNMPLNYTLGLTAIMLNIQNELIKNHDTISVIKAGIHELNNYCINYLVN